MRRSYGPQLWFYPLPLVVVGARVREKPTFTPIAWCTPVEDDPPLVLSVIAKEHYILSEREKLSVYSLNFPSEDQIVAADYCGMVSGYTHDKSTVFEVEYGKHGAPLIVGAPLSLECRVRQWLDVGESCWLLVGEVVESYAEETLLREGKPDVSHMKLLAYITKSGEYRALGKVVARARHVGRQFRKE
ncbi:MAG: flavin reductase family protein [Brevinematales bacterium]|nr:flavin reductase family protein [Brevinematales bacterium]